MASSSEDISGLADETRITIEDSKTNNGDLVVSLKDKLKFERHMITSDCCIFRVPERLRNVNNEAFTPQVVSIGPFHHCKSECYKAMDNNKFHYLNALLSRSNSKTLEVCVNKIKVSETKARECYAEYMDLTSHEFVEIMLLDGCFIIELFLRNRDTQICKEGSDPLFRNIHVKSALRDDLLLLENQLPFFVLDDLFNLIKTHDNNCENTTFLQLALLYFYDIKPENGQRGLSPKHLLDLALQLYIPSKQNDGNISIGNNDDDIVPIPTATSLKEAGVKLIRVTEKHLLDIKFENGVLEIPVIEVEDTTEILFRNMMAFEQCYGHTTYVADYTTLMDHLINTAEDVSLLRRRGIITSWLGDDEEVSHMFNELGRNISSSDRFYYGDLYKRLNAYYKEPWHSWKARLKQDYFHNPWSTIAFIAAGIGLICTVAQTAFSIK